MLYIDIDCRSTELLCARAALAGKSRHEVAFVAGHLGGSAKLLMSQSKAFSAV